MIKFLWVINLISKGIFTLIAAKYLEPKNFVSLMSIFIIQEGFFALIKSPVDMFLMRDGNAEKRIFWSISLSVNIIIIIATLILLLLNIENKINLFLAFFLTILKLPFLLKSKIDIINGKPKKSFLNVFWSDSLPLIIMAIALFFLKFSVVELLCIHLFSLVIIVISRRDLYLSYYGVSIKIIKDFLFTIPGISIYGVSISYWLSAERLFAIKIFHDEILVGYLLLILRFSSMFISLTFGYFSTINYSVVIMGEKSEKQNLILRAILYYIFVCIAGVVLSLTIAEPLLINFFPLYRDVIDIISIPLIGLYIASFNLLLFLFIFIEKNQDVFKLLIFSLILYSLLFANFIYSNSINEFYFILTTGLLILCTYVGLLSYEKA